MKARNLQTSNAPLDTAATLDRIIGSACYSHFSVSYQHKKAWYLEHVYYLPPNILSSYDETSSCVSSSNKAISESNTFYFRVGAVTFISSVQFSTRLLFKVILIQATCFVYIYLYRPIYSTKACPISPNYPELTGGRYSVVRIANRYGWKVRASNPRVSEIF